MALRPELLEILACPACHSTPLLESTGDDGDTLTCTGCRRRYPIRDRIPVLLVDEAVLPDSSSRPGPPGDDRESAPESDGERPPPGAGGGANG